MFLAICYWKALDLFFTPGEEIHVPEFTKSSFWIYALHINVGATVTKLFYILLPKTTGMALLNFVLTSALTLIGIELLRRIVNKISPKCYAVLTGNRVK